MMSVLNLSYRSNYFASSYDIVVETSTAVRQEISGSQICTFNLIICHENLLSYQPLVKFSETDEFFINYGSKVTRLIKFSY